MGIERQVTVFEPGGSEPRRRLIEFQDGCHIRGNAVAETKIGWILSEDVR
jgi:hypothetical protein